MPSDLWEMMRHGAAGVEPELVDVGTPEEIERKMNHQAGQVGVPLLRLGDGLAYRDGECTVTAGPASKRTVAALRQLVQRQTEEEE
jgi:hypothetical protein